MNKNTSLLTKNIYIFKYIFKFCKGIIPHLIIYVISSVAKSLVKVLFINKVLKMVLENNSLDIKNIISELAIYLILLILCSVINVIYDNYTSVKYSKIYQMKIKRFLFSKIKTINTWQFDDPEFYDRFDMACWLSPRRSYSMFQSLTKFIIHILTIITLGTYIVVNDILLLAILIISSVANAIFLNIINKLWYKLYKNIETDNRMKWFIQNMFYNQNNTPEIKSTNVSNLLTIKYSEANDKIEDKYKSFYKTVLVPNMFNQMITTLASSGATYLLLTLRLLKKVIDVTTFTSCINAVTSFSYNLSSSISLYSSIKENSLFIDDFMWVTTYEGIKERKKEYKGITFNELKMDKVSFNYNKSNDLVLDDLSININKNERIGIVGENGSGKTTLVKLLLSFYDPKGGVIEMNNLNYLDLDVTEIRNLYSIIFQDYNIYSVTLAENILMRRIKNDEDIELVHSVLKSVGLFDKVMKLKDGINTKVTREFMKDGAVFSGGEKQRIAIARVLASNKELYILDEPTSSLDPLSEARINKLLIDNSDNKTIIIIAHRLSSIVDMDMIYLISDGKVLEKGTHKELLEKNGHYALMFNTQKRLYERELKNER